MRRRTNWLSELLPADRTNFQRAACALPSNEKNFRWNCPPAPTDDSRFEERLRLWYSLETKTRRKYLRDTASTCLVNSEPGRNACFRPQRQMNYPHWASNAFPYSPQGNALIFRLTNLHLSLDTCQRFRAFKRREKKDGTGKKDDRRGEKEEREKATRVTSRSSNEGCAKTGKPNVIRE